MNKVLLAIALRVLPKTLLGVSTGTLLAALPEVIGALRTLGGVIARLKADGKPETEATKAAFEMVAKVRRMTPEEERAWMDRASAPGG